MVSVRKIDGSEGTVPIERLHRKTVAVDDISLADFDHGAAIGANPPRRIEQLPNERIKYDIHAATVGSRHNLYCEFGIAR